MDHPINIAIVIVAICVNRTRASGTLYAPKPFFFYLSGFRHQSMRQRCPCIFFLCCSAVHHEHKLVCLDCGFVFHDLVLQHADQNVQSLSIQISTEHNKEAKATDVTAKDEARVARLGAESGKLNAGMRNMANPDEREANYKSASARCGGITGASKHTCAAEAKSEYGMT